MNITQQPTGELTATIKVEIAPEDYTEKVDKVLKDHQRKASLHGFRPGKAPFGLIKKIYGNAVLSEEVNKLVSEAITKYLLDKNIDVIGYPLPSLQKSPEVDFLNETEFTLYFDLGLTPVFDLNLSADLEVDYYTILVDPQDVEKEIERFRERYGTVSQHAAADENGWLDGEILQLDEHGNKLEGGIKSSGYVFIRTLPDQQQRERFIGAEVGDVIDFDIREVFSTDIAIARFLRITESKATAIEGRFSFAVKEVLGMVPSEMNHDFFEKVFPGHGDMDESHFRNHISERVKSNYSGESEKLFLKQAIEKIIEANPFNLPDEFLKRWIKVNSRKEISAEEIEKNYPEMVNGFKWDIIRQKLNEKFSLEANDEGVQEYVRSYFTHRYGHQLEVDESRINKVVDEFMTKEEEVEKVRDEIFSNRLITTLKLNLGINNKEVTIEEFLALNK